MTTVALEEITANPIKTPDATLTVEMPREKLAVGSHTFQLQVVDDSGNVSVPAQVMLIVVDTQAPTAVLVATDENGRALPDNRISYGSNFILNGSKSVDIGGKITTYVWTLVG